MTLFDTNITFYNCLYLINWLDDFLYRFILHLSPFTGWNCSHFHWLCLFSAYIKSYSTITSDYVELGITVAKVRENEVMKCVACEAMKCVEGKSTRCVKGGGDQTCES